MWRTADQRYASLPNSEGGAKPADVYAPLPEQSRIWRILRFTIFVVSGVLVLSSFGVNIWLLIERRGEQDFSPFPRLPLEDVVFEDHPHFTGPPSVENDAVWENLITDMGTLGFVNIDDSDRYGLPPGMPYNGTMKVYGVSMFHQLHCLRMIRNVFWAASSQVSDHEREHVAHCFDYLRQGIQCGGDMSLEWANWGGPPRIDGWGIKHRGCKSLGAAGDLMRKHEVDGYVET